MRWVWGWVFLEMCFLMVWGSFGFDAPVVSAGLRA